MFQLIFLLISQLAVPQIQIFDITAVNEGKDNGQIFQYTDSVIYHSYDVYSYTIELEINSPFNTIAGNSSMYARALSNIDTIDIHLGSNLTIDSLFADGSKITNFNRIGDTVYIPYQVNSNNTFTTLIYYNGNPDAGFFDSEGGFYTQVQVTEDSKEWWPCYDYCWDKADSGIDITITVPDTIYVVANGTLVDLDTLSGGRLKYFWEHDYAITTYLVAIAGYNYTILTDSFHGYPIVYYARPGYESQAQAMQDSTPIILDLFDTLIAPYPFSDDKMGQLQTGGGGAMEHQTCIRYGPATYSNIIVHGHEIAHSWWGDAVTCINYGQMFLNEGTTSYYECLAAGALRGEGWFYGLLAYMRGSALGSIYPVLNCPVPFSGSTVYHKGALFHRMLNTMLGDSAYFTAMKEYYQTYKWGNASVSELQSIMENYYGDTLDWFFYQWLEIVGAPKIFGYWIYDNDTLDITLKQVQSNGFIYKLPIEIGWTRNDTLYVSQTFWMEDSVLNIKIVTTGKPDTVAIDPFLKILVDEDGILSMDNQILIIDDGNGSFGERYKTILGNLGISSSLWNISEYGYPSQDLFSNAEAVFWVTGSLADPISNDDKTTINSMIANNIPIAFFSPKLPAQFEGTTFLQDTLGCNFSDSSTTEDSLIGNSGDPIGDNMVFDVNPIYANVITPISNGAGCAFWDGVGSAIVRNNTGLDIVLSTVDAYFIRTTAGYNTKEELLTRILEYFGISVNVEEIFEKPVAIPNHNIRVAYLQNGNISLTINVGNPSTLKIYDLSGRIVNSWEVEGEQTIVWDRRDNNSSILPAGRYFVNITGVNSAKQLILSQ